MIKQSRLLFDTNIDIKIQRGLKILQFATQYNLRKAYYRNCPLNVPEQSVQKLSSKAKTFQILKNNQMADIMCQLNQQLFTCEQELREHDLPKDNSKLAIIQPVSRISQSDRSILSKSKSIKDSQKSNSQANLQEVSNYVSQTSKLQPIRESIEPSKQQQPSVKLQTSTISNKSKKPKIQVVKQLTTSAKYIQTQKQQSNVKDISKSIKQGSKINSIKPKDSQILSSSNLLNNSISKITSKSSKGIKQSSKSNISQFQLLKQLSQSFVDEENMKMLLKLQNCELQQKYLEQRIVNRLEKGYKDVKKINDISWESLKLPRMDYSFKRPNYAHIIQ